MQLEWDNFSPLGSREGSHLFLGNALLWAQREKLGSLTLVWGGQKVRGEEFPSLEASKEFLDVALDALGWGQGEDRAQLGLNDPKDLSQPQPFHEGVVGLHHHPSSEFQHPQPLDPKFWIRILTKTGESLFPSNSSSGCNHGVLTAELTWKGLEGAASREGVPVERTQQGFGIESFKVPSNRQNSGTQWEQSANTSFMSYAVLITRDVKLWDQIRSKWDNNHCRFALEPAGPGEGGFVWLWDPWLWDKSCCWS